MQTFLSMQLERKIITVLSDENKGRHPCAVRLSLVTSMLNTMTAYKIADEKLIAKHLKMLYPAPELFLFNVHIC